MRKMEEKKGNIVRHIQSARQWLERAEHAVKSESSTRGELDLILAKAEVQLAQEKRSNTAEMPAKIMTYALRPQNMLTMAMGGLAVCMLLIFNMWQTFGQGVNIPADYSLQNKTQLETPATMSLNTPLVSAPPVQERRESSEMPREEKKDTSGNPAPLLLATTNNTAVVRSATEPATTVQVQATAVSEQEIRMLMRTAERVLKDTK